MDSMRNEEHNGRTLRLDTSKRFALVAFTVGFIASVFAGRGSAATLTVGTCQPNGYAGIQEAIGSAASGDTVQVCPGTYSESLLIAKNLTLVGLSRGEVVARIEYPEGERRCLTSVCPQIEVTSGATAQISDLYIDGANFSGPCGQFLVGIEILGASATIASNTITNHVGSCGRGIGIIAAETDPISSYSVQVSNNTITNWSSHGIDLGGNTQDTQNPAVNKLNATIFDNTIASTIGTYGIVAGFIEDLAITGNTITIPDGVSGYLSAPISVNYSKNATIDNNTLANGFDGIELTEADSSTFLLNQISNVLGQGILVECSSNNLFLGNTMAPSSAGTNSIGINLYDSTGDPACGSSPTGSDDDRMLFNTFDGFCAGVGEGSVLNVGTVVLDNTFNNVGMDEISGNSCL